MSKGLTEKQRKVLEHIIDYQKENGYPPTIREIGDTFGIGSLRGVTVHLDALVRKGHLTRDRSSRSLRVIGTDPRGVPATGADSFAAASGSAMRVETVLSLPLLRGYGFGDIASDAAGAKIETMEPLIERYVAIPEELAASATPDGFVVRVGASGISGEAILPGDLLVARPQQGVLRGELAVQVTFGDISVRRHDPANEHGGDFQDDSSRVVGRVVGLIRRY